MALHMPDRGPSGPGGAASDLSLAKPAKADSERIPFLGGHFMTDDLRGQHILYLWGSW